MPFLTILKPLIKEFASNWKVITLACMIFVLYYQNFSSKEVLRFVGLRSIPAMEHKHEQEIQNITAKLQLCQQNEVLLKEQINNTNMQIQRWSTISNQMQKQHDQLLKELDDMQRKTQKQVNDILEGPTPETCEAAIDYLKNAAQGELKWKK